MSFEPRTKVELDPPKDDPISLEYLSKCDGISPQHISPRYIARQNSATELLLIGTHEGFPTYVAIKVCSILVRSGIILMRSR